MDIFILTFLAIAVFIMIVGLLSCVSALENIQTISSEVETNEISESNSEAA